MRTFGRGMLYSIIVVVILLAISFIIGDTVTLPWFVFIPLVLLVWGLAFYQSRNEDRSTG
ncbi:MULTISPECIES: hypothetical protein [Paenibacillus]|jgi:hypothetical protein|uniref:hypothetical protein n=1 Tax=Paenibacillus TaxID=44249 RepID=UPI0004F5F143|nr:MULTISPECIES: hypothetical protein [unclassified Paenibacillus]AIQ29846.1 hypothetical protein P40081_18035 [Paenibacillus sp. FSL P4-0081]OMF21700.1 hypothetical protein BK132_31845 [Paenibacillus sp. FSL H8-0259]